MEKLKVKYIRVSSPDQNIERQNDFKGITFIDRCSGAIPFELRPHGKKLLEKVRENEISEVHVHSLDRLGRNLSDILDVVQMLTNYKCCLVLEKEGIRTLDRSGRKSLTSNLLISILAAVAQSERELIKERQKEGIEIARRKGKYKGRLKGTGMSVEQLLKKHRKVALELQKGESLRRAALIGGVSLGTAQRVNKAMSSKHDYDHFK